MKSILRLIIVPVLILVILFSGQRAFCLNDAQAGKTAIVDAERLIKNKEYPKAEKILLDYVDDKDLNLRREVLYGLGRVYYFQGSFGQARKNLETALTIKQNFDHFKESQYTHTLAGIFVYLSYVFMEGGDYKRSISILEKAVKTGLVESNKNNFHGSNIYSLIARNYLFAGDFVGAKEYALKSLKLDIKNHATAHTIKQISLLLLGEVYRNSGDYVKAVNYFKEVVRNSQEENDHTLKGYIGLCDAYLLKGDYRSALDECAEKIRISEGGVIRWKGLYNLGVINFKNNKPAEAEDYFKKTVEMVEGLSPLTKRQNYSYNLDRYSALAHYSLGVCYSLNKNYEQALIEFKKAIELAFHIKEYGLTDKVVSGYLNISARYELIKVLEAQGEKAAAEKERVNLAEFIKSVPAKEKSMIEERKFDVYIEGEPLKEILKELAVL